MPGMRGDTMVAEMRTHPDLAFVPVIVLSAQANDNLRLDLLRNAAPLKTLCPALPLIL